MIFLCNIFLRSPRHFEWCELPFQDCTTLPFCLLLIVGVDWAIFVIATTRSKIVAKIFMVWLLVSCTICIVVVINDDWVLTNGTTRVFLQLTTTAFLQWGKIHLTEFSLAYNGSRWAVLGLLYKYSHSISYAWTRSCNCLKYLKCLLFGAN